MKIYKLNFDVNQYENLMPVIPFDFKTIQSFDGRKHLKSWKRLAVSRMEPEKGLPLGDAPGFTIPVFSAKALDCLLPLIKDFVEVLPLEFEEEYYGINVTTVLNCIDYIKASFKTFHDGKKIMLFERYAFTNAIDGYPIFKIVDEKTRSAFVNEDFKKCVENNGLQGFKLKSVWDSSL